jgi:glutamate-1-semialdehyde 2,1-aminomutase
MEEADHLNRIAPAGPVYQAGTLSGNPLAMAAGIAMLDEIRRRPPYEGLEALGARLEADVRGAIARLEVGDRVCYERVGSLSTLFFCPGPVRDFASVKRSDTKRYAAFFHAMRERGIFPGPVRDVVPFTRGEERSQEAKAVEGAGAVARLWGTKGPSQP